MGSTQPFTQVLEVLFPEVKWAKHETDHSHPVPKFRKTGAISSHSTRLLGVE